MVRHIMNKLTVNLGERSYPIHIGPGLLGSPQGIGGGVGDGRKLIVTDETVAPIYLDAARGFVEAMHKEAAGTGAAHKTVDKESEVHHLVLPDGERHKHLETVNRIYDYLLENRFDRGSVLIALGGGVIGDIVGFAAATYQRGVGFVQIPTTLLAQVDSSVGGKTGVNHPLGKNMIGAFHQPQAVFIDTDVLRTLPERELKAGMAEVLKYGLLGDARFFDWLADNSKALMSLDNEVTGEAVRRCCEAKAAIVAADEKETGARALLNLGHTFGHAIETATGYGTYLHGEAVAMGMLMAADLSMRQNLLPQKAAHRIRKVLEQDFGLTVIPPAIDEAKYLTLMSSDKKATKGRLRLILLRAIGEAFITTEVDPDSLSATLNARDRLCQ